MGKTLQDHMQEKKTVGEKLKKLQNENGDLKSQIESKQSEFQKHASQLKKKRQKIEDLKKENKDLKDQRAKYESEVNEKETKFKEVESEKNYFQEQNKELKNYSQKEKEKLEAELSDQKTKEIKYVQMLRKLEKECSMLKEEIVKLKKRPGRKCLVLSVIILSPWRLKIVQECKLSCIIFCP